MRESRINTYIAGEEINYYESEGWKIISHYNAFESEYKNARNGTALFDLSHWTKIALTGSEKKTFLHGMVTNEVSNLQSGEGNYSLFLTPKGKILADFFLFDAGENLMLFAQEKCRKPLVEGLNKYLIMEDATIHDNSEEQALFSLQGSDVLNTLSTLFSQQTLLEKDNFFTKVDLDGIPCCIFHLTHLSKPGFDLLTDYSQAETVWSKLVESGAIPTGMKVWDVLRVESGRPALGRELDDSIIPQEAALHHAISFQKGCYIGQETVARLHFRGHVNRELTGFVVDHSIVPEAELTVMQDEKPVGKITSAVYSPAMGKIIGLGYLKCSLKKTGTSFPASGNGVECTVTVHELPFIDA